jgi:hypothetical protein
MAIFTLPRSFQSNVFSPQNPMAFAAMSATGSSSSSSSSFITSAPSQHPPFFHLVLLVFEAVLEVICVSLPGYFAARQGMFDAEAQKLVANLNVTLFTPCLSMDLPSLLEMGTIVEAGRDN